MHLAAADAAQAGDGDEVTELEDGDAIVMREREKSRYQREKRQGRIEDIDVGDLLVSGVELAWKYFRH